MSQFVTEHFKMYSNKKDDEIIVIDERSKNMDMTIDRGSNWKETKNLSQLFTKACGNCNKQSEKDEKYKLCGGCKRVAYCGTDW